MKNTKNWKRAAIDILKTGSVVPVIVIPDLDHAVPLAKALVAGGIRVPLVTLRTPVAVEAISDTWISL
jgi:2-dehydro-3-deoxyphosphogluconate aldolase/(4S)-4-hydroxy-2-oxoglutarate aldolase